MPESTQTNLLFTNDSPGVYPDSWYHASANPPAIRPSLKGDKSFDVVIIGAGFTGLSAGLHLSSSGYRVAILDAHRAGWGASGRNGGQLGSGQRVDQEQLQQQYGVAQAAQLWELAEESKALVRGLIKQYAIDCDYRSGIIDADHKRSFSRSTARYVEMLQQQYGYTDIEYIQGDELSAALGTDQYHSASVDHGAGHLHPLKFALGLAAAAEACGACIFESTLVERIQPTGNAVEVQTQHGKITADSVLLACNGYLGDLQPEVAEKVMPINNYILATQPLEDDLYQSILSNDMAVADSRFVVNYYRKSSDHRLLFGGRESYGYKFPQDIKSFVRKAMLNVYPQLNDVQVDYGWGGTLAITMNRMPNVCCLSPGVYSASGYSGHGVGMATLSGKLVAEAIGGTLNKFDVMAAIKHRNFPGGARLRSPLLKLGMLYYSLRDRL